MVGVPRHCKHDRPMVSTSPELYKGEACFVLRPGLGLKAACLAPKGPVNDREMNISLGRAFHKGDVHAIGPADQGRIEIGATCQDDFARVHGFCPLNGKGQSCFEIMREMDRFGFEIDVAGQDDRLAARPRAANRLEGLAAHEHGLAHGERAKMRTVAREVPGQAATGADNAISCNRRNNGERWSHGPRTELASCESAAPSSRQFVHWSIMRASSAL